MPDPGRPRRVRLRARDVDEVAPVELFFDLVFVFAITQVTAQMAHDLTLHGIVRGMMVTGLLWWSWVGYAWMGNVVHVGDVTGRLAILLAMVPMFVLAVAVPEAFHDLSGGLTGPVVVAVSYFLVRAIHLSLYWAATAGDRAGRAQLVRFAGAMVAGVGLLATASQVHGWARTACWALALIGDYVGTYVGGAEGWTVRSSSHFAERHGLIVIVALGESVVAIGVGVGSMPTSLPVVTACALGLVVSAALWWSYFDRLAARCAAVLEASPERTRARLARDVYSFLHLPMIAAILLVALGLKEILIAVAGASSGGAHGDHGGLDPLVVLVLYGGAALALLSEVAIVWRATGSVDRVRCGGALGVLVVGAVLSRSSPLVVLLGAAVAGVVVAAAGTLRRGTTLAEG